MIINCARFTQLVMHRILLFLQFFISTVIFAQHDCYLRDPDAGARGKNVDFKHLKLNLELLPEKGMVKGTVEHTFSPLQIQVDSVFLDAPKITVQKVLLNDKEVKFETNDKGLIVRFQPALKWETTHKLTITYEATPKKGIYFLGWNEPASQSKMLTAVRKQIWTQGQGIDNRHWIPMYDDMNDKITSEILLSFDKKYKVLSNGKLISSKEQKDGSVAWHYKMTYPHAPYLIMLTVGDYSIRSTKTKRGVDVHNWFYPDFPETVEPTYRYTENMIDWMEQEYGVNYPWEQYSQIPVQDFMFGAMENTTATIFGDFYVIDNRAFLDRSYVGTNAHELVHQWFGDYITAWGAEDTWLQESFATHYQKHFERSIYGEDHFQWNRRNELGSVLAAAKENNNPIRHTKAGTARFYPKGSLVLDMFRYVLGDEQYKKAVTHYLKKHAYNNVDNNDFNRAFLESLGINMNWFFEQWVLKGGEPKYKVSYNDITKNSNRYTEINVEQIHQTDDVVGLFKMPIVFQVYYKDGSKSEVKEWIEKQTQTISILNEKNKDIDFVLFDPNYQIIKTVEFKKSLEELKAQASKAPNMIDRYDALKELSKEKIEDKKDFLIELFKKEPFHANRAEIAKQLVKHIDKLDAATIQLLVNDKHARVRQSAIDNTEKIPAEYFSAYEKLLTDSSYNVVEKTLEKLAEQNPEKLQQYLNITKNDIGVGSGVKVKWHLLATQIDKQKNTDELVKLSSSQYEFRTRGNALNALKQLNYLDDELVKNLFNALTHFNTRLNAPAKKVAEYFMEQKEFKDKLTAFYKNNTWDTHEKNKLKDLFE